jgi:hypothetical protein
VRKVRAIVLASLLASSCVLAASCAIDTEIGLDATIDDASLDVRAATEGDVVALTMAVTYRVGEHAQESHELMPQAIDVFAGDILVATISPNRPPGFVPMVRPGQTFSTTFTGESAPGVATDPRSLCGAEATLLFRWTDASNGTVGMTESTTSAITCD